MPSQPDDLVWTLGLALTSGLLGQCGHLHDLTETSGFVVYTLCGRMLPTTPSENEMIQSWTDLDSGNKTVPGLHKHYINFCCYYSPWFL